MDKETLLPTRKPHKCRRCGEPAPFEEGVSKCLSCGQEEVDRRQRHKFLEGNKGEILRDVLTIGSTKAKQKWGLSDATFETIKRRWQLRKVWSVPLTTNGLPKLPAWRDDWPDELKLKWFEAYQLNLGIMKRKGVLHE